MQTKFNKGQLVDFDDRIFEIESVKEEGDKIFYDLKLIAHIKRQNGEICEHFDNLENINEDELRSFDYNPPRYHLGEKRRLGIIHLIVFNTYHRYVYNLAPQVIDGYIGVGGGIAGASESDI